MTVQKVLAGRYELRLPVGVGPHGTMWRATALGTGAAHAVKILAGEYARDERVVRRLRDAAPALAERIHPVWEPVTDLVIEGDTAALVSGLITGVDLRRWISRGGSAPVVEALTIAASCAGALAAAHERGIVHRNIKPSNVLFADDGSVHLTDARMGWLTGRDGDTHGEPAPADDIRQLGALLHEMITGRPPGDDESSAPLTEAAGAGVAALVQACLAARPADRPNATELAARLQAAAVDTSPALLASPYVGRRRVDTGEPDPGPEDSGSSWAVGSPSGGWSRSSPTSSGSGRRLQTAMPLKGLYPLGHPTPGSAPETFGGASETFAVAAEAEASGGSRSQATFGAPQESGSSRVSGSAGADGGPMPADDLPTVASPPPASDPPAGSPGGSPAVSPGPTSSGRNRVPAPASPSFGKPYEPAPGRRPARLDPGPLWKQPVPVEQALPRVAPAPVDPPSSRPVPPVALPAARPPEPSSRQVPSVALPPETTPRSAPPVALPAGRPSESSSRPAPAVALPAARKPETTPRPLAAPAAVPEVPAMTTRPARRPMPPGRQRAAATAGILTTAVATGAVLLAVAYSTGRAPTPDAGPEPPASLATASVAAPIPSGPATELSSEGAKAFVPYWFTTLDHALRTGDTSALAAASDPSCTACADAIAAITEAYREGGAIRDAGYVVRSVNPDSFFTLDRPILRVVVDRSPGTVVGPDGTPRRTLPRFTFLSCQVALTRAGDTWTVSDLQTTAPLA